MKIKVNTSLNTKGCLHLAAQVIRPSLLLVGLVAALGTSSAFANRPVASATVTLDSAPIGNGILVNGKWQQVQDTPENNKNLQKLQSGSQADIWQDAPGTPGVAGTGTPKIKAIKAR